MSGPFDWEQEDKAMARWLEEQEGTYPASSQLPLPEPPDPNQLTVDDVVDALITESVCPVCESDDVGWMDEVYGDQGTGMMMKACLVCGYVFPDDGTISTRRYVGC